MNTNVIRLEGSLRFFLSGTNEEKPYTVFLFLRGYFCSGKKKRRFSEKKLYEVHQTFTNMHFFWLFYEAEIIFEEAIPTR